MRGEGGGVLANILVKLKFENINMPAPLTDHSPPAFPPDTPNLKIPLNFLALQIEPNLVLLEHHALLLSTLLVAS